MINTVIAVLACLVSLIIGCLLGIGLMYVLLMWPKEYTEKSDFTSTDWAKDYEEIRNEPAEVS